jgi:hypothetical protein
VFDHLANNVILGFLDYQVYGIFVGSPEAGRFLQLFLHGTGQNADAMLDYLGTVPEEIN